MPPLTVEPSAVDDCGVLLRAACARLDDLGTFVAGPARVADWWGASAQSYRSSSAAVGRGADAMSLALRRVAARVLEHAGELVRLESRHDELVQTRALLVGAIETLRDDVRATAPDRVIELAPVLQARSDAVSARVTTYESDRERWVGDLDLEEREVIAELRRWRSLGDVDRALGGAPDPADDALLTLPPPGAAPVLVHAWWLGLSPAERAGLVVAAPGAIGNLPGVPALARHRANVVRLARDLATLRALRGQRPLSDDEQSALRNAEAVERACERVEEVVDPRTGEPVPVRLYLYDPSAFDGDGAAVVAVGDPDTADDVSVVVPGMMSDGAAIGGVTTDAIAVYEAARGANPDATHASLAWVGYDAPDTVPLSDGLLGDVVGVAGEGMAERGGEHLAESVEGLRAERSRPEADLTVIGHSYGSTTVGYAAHDHGLPVDDLVVVGSPGLGDDVHDTSDLGLAPEQVWVGADSRDLVADLAGNGSLTPADLFGLGLGDDPAGDDFGAIRFQAESTTRGLLDGLDHHDHYFDHDTESLHNIAAIVSGGDDEVDRAEPITDPWWGPAHDPERDRAPTTPPTRPR